MVVDASTTPSTLMVLVKPTDAAFGATVYLSQPAGSGASVTATWTSPPELPAGLPVTQAALDPNLHGTVYLATGAGLYVSQDHGATWATEGAGLPSNRVLAVGVDRTLLGPLWAATAGGLAVLDRGGCKAGPGLPGACLDDARFQTQVSYVLGGQSAAANVVQLSDDTAAFWFTDPSSYELLVKVLDGSAVNGDDWVFSGGLSNVEYTVSVTDILTGAVRTYPKAAGILQSFADTTAFADAAPNRPGTHPVPPPAPAAARSAAARPAACSADSTDLCLAGSRFRVAVSWNSGSLSGAGQAVPLTGDTGSFWFLAADNYELTVKVLDGTAVNGHFWVFYGAMTDFAFTLTVTDSTDGTIRTYTNTAGTIPSAADTSAF